LLKLTWTRRQLFRARWSLGRADQAAPGKAERTNAPRSNQPALPLAGDRDPLDLLESQARSRVPELVPIRYGRRLVSLLAFFRGAATVMAHGLEDN
jgi:hypothetical protein